MHLLAINWSEVGIKAGQFVLSFSIIVVLHELGHFIPARIFKCRVEKFYLFFNPWFSLWKKKIGETEWGVGWIPFGGYVKISGMIDESMDKEQMKQPAQPWEFRAKPAWQRLIIMVGGVFINLVLGFLIYAMMLWYWGEEFVPTNKFTYGIYTDSLAKSIGLQDGDKIASVDGQYIERFNKIPLKVILNGARSIQVDRNGQAVDIPIPEDFAGKLIKYKDLNFIDMRVPLGKVDSMKENSLAGRVGIEKGDSIIAINGVTTRWFQDFSKEVMKNRGKQVDITLLRGAETKHITAEIPKNDGLGIYGVYYLKPEAIFDVKKITYGFFEAIPAGFTKSLETLQSYWLQLKLIFSGKVKTSESLGSVFSIANMFPAKWDWESFWAMTAFFSLVLALMNILPIPALDGGHALFTIIEMVTRRKPNEKVIEYAQLAGMVLLLSLMTYALGLDIFRIFK
jgi:regulator of sigma E protease